MVSIYNASSGAITGEIKQGLFSSASLPFGWLLCDGSTFDAAAYPRLNTLLGGNTLPDLRDARPIGATAESPAGTLAGSNAPTVPVPLHSHDFQSTTRDYSAASETTTSGKMALVGSGVTASSATQGGISNILSESMEDTTTKASIANAGIDGVTLDVRGKSLSVNFIIYAL